MNPRELIKQAAKQCIYGEKGLMQYFKSVGEDINSKKISEICDEIYKRYEFFKAGKKRFNQLSLFLNIETEKTLKKLKLI